MILTIFLFVAISPRVTVNGINGNTLAVFSYCHNREGIYPAVEQHAGIELALERFTLLHGGDVIKRIEKNRKQHRIFARKYVTLTITFHNPFLKIDDPIEESCTLRNGLEWDDGERIDFDRTESSFKVQTFDADGILQQEMEVNSENLRFFDLEDNITMNFAITDDTIPLSIRAPNKQRQFFLYEIVLGFGGRDDIVLAYRPEADDVGKIEEDEDGFFDEHSFGIHAHYDSRTGKLKYWLGWDRKRLNSVEVLDWIDRIPQNCPSAANDASAEPQDAECGKLASYLPVPLVKNTFLEYDLAERPLRRIQSAPCTLHHDAEQSWT